MSFEPTYGTSIGSDSDTTPVFFASKKLRVTGMKVTVGSCVYPVSAVSGVEIHSRTLAYLIDNFKLGFAGVLVIVVAVSFRDFLVGVMQLTPMILILTAIFGLLTIVLACLGVITYVMEKRVHLSFSSGDSIDVKEYDKKTILAMHSALDRAIAFDANRAAGSLSVANELHKLSELRSNGAISENDWNRAKDLFLGKQPDAQQRAVHQLRQLFELHTSGVLSESEFNMKKWDVLSRSGTQVAVGRPHPSARAHPHDPTEHQIAY